MKKVWVGLGTNFLAVEIYKSLRECIQASPKYYIQLNRAVAVEEIRKQIWDRTDGECEWCGSFITEAFHMHEVIPRGEGGNISLENSVGICASCHLNDAHGDRKPRFGDHKSDV